MNFTNRITSTACFDREAYADIAKDEKGMGPALGVVALAGAACGIGLGKGSLPACIDLTVFALVVFAIATATAFLAAHRYDPAAWRWRRAMRAVRILGYSTSPGIAGIVGFLFGAKFVVMAGIWCAASYLYALRLAFDYKPEGANGPIGLIVTLVSGVAAWGYSTSIRGGMGFLTLLLFVAVCVFHKPVLRWIFGKADRASGETKKQGRSLWRELGLQLARTRALFRRKGWDVTLRELVETFTLIKTRRKAASGEAEPPPLPLPVDELNKEESAAEEPKASNMDEVDDAGSRSDASLGESKDDSEDSGKEETADAKDEVVGEIAGEPGSDSGGSGKADQIAVEEKTPAQETEAEGEGITPERVAQKEAAPAEVVEASEDSMPELNDVCERIFNEDISGYESNRTFRDEFKGRNVRWSGEVRQVEAFTYDTVFGGEAGAKALLEIAELSTGYGKLPIEAVLRIPPDGLQAAENLLGEKISFSGELLESDPYARRLFLSGELLES